MLGRRRRRSSSSEPTLGQRIRVCWAGFRFPCLLGQAAFGGYE